MATSPASVVSDLRTDIRIDPNGKLFSDAVLLKFINQAIRKLEVDLSFETNANASNLTSTASVAGTQEYALPTDLTKIEIIQYNDGSATFDLRSISFNDARSLNPTDTQGKPSHYYLRGTSIGLYPIPESAGTIKIYYRGRTTALVDAGANLEMNDEYVPAIVKWASYLAWSSSRGNEATAEQKKKDYLEELNQLEILTQAKDPLSLTYFSSRKRANMLPANFDRVLTLILALFLAIEFLAL